MGIFFYVQDQVKMRSIPAKVSSKWFKQNKVLDSNKHIKYTQACTFLIAQNGKGAGEKHALNSCFFLQLTKK